MKNVNQWQLSLYAILWVAFAACNDETKTDKNLVVSDYIQQEMEKSKLEEVPG